jgi:hypothetical protein
MSEKLAFLKIAEKEGKKKLSKVFFCAKFIIKDKCQQQKMS